MTAPDQDMRARLRALAEHEPLSTLTAAERVLAEGAAEASLRTRERRGFGLALAGSLSLMLASFVCWRVFTEPPRRVADTSAPVASTQATRCRAFHERTIEDAPLAGRATFAAAPSSEVLVSLSADCDVDAELRTGSLYVHASNLEGRALRVRTPHGRVEVRGTIFAVHATKDALAVEVDEGHVEVFPTDSPSLSLRAGQAVRIEARASQPSIARLPARNVLRTAVKLAPREQDAGAERIWQTGSVPAPSIPPEPGTSLTEDGRPMRKPRLTQGD